MTHPFEKLAVEGGTPSFPDGPLPWPPELESVREALCEAWESGDWGRYDGSLCSRLCEKIRENVAARHVHLCCSGTFAVELALRAMNVAAGDEVILAAYDFGGNFRAIEDVGALPVLVDLTAKSWCIDPDEVERAITPRTRAIIVSHLHGTQADVRRLREIADKHGIGLVEDACQAHGADIHGKPAGSHGHVGVWSFGGSKLLTAGRGGAIITDDPAIAQRAKVFCERSNNAFPLSELQAAVLIPQLANLQEDTRRREKSVSIIRKVLSGNASVQVGAESTGLSAYYKLGLWFDTDARPNVSIDDFLSAAVAEGIDLGRGFRGFHRRPPSRCRKIGELANARHAAEATLLLHHPVLLQGDEVAVRVAEGLNKVDYWLHCR